MMSTTGPTRRELVNGHLRPEDFRHRAACRSVDVSVFFPTAVRGRAYETQVSIAKAVCAGCPVLSECLTWSLSALPDGIAGGMTEHERRAEQARRRDGRRHARLPRPQVPRRPVNATRAELAAAGQAALAAGASVQDVAGEFQVSPRTADRWARTVATHATAARSRTSEGARSS